MADPGAGRRPTSVYGVGDEPDPRFSLANERTALAWTRTSLGLVAGGAAITSLAHVEGSPRWLILVGAGLAASGGLLVIGTLLGWRRTERALRLRLPLPAPRMLPVLVGAVACVGIVVAVLAVVEFLQ